MRHANTTENERSYQLGPSRLTLRFGDITDSTAQVLVSSDDNYLTMGGGVSAAILRSGGDAILLDAAKKVPADVGDVIVTCAGNHAAQYVFHAITLDLSLRHGPSDKVVESTVRKCLELLEALGLQSIAFPAIGTGVARFDYADVAVEMAHTISAHLTSTDSKLDVTVFLYDAYGRFGPIDYSRFFEEFRVRVPSAAPLVNHEPPGKEDDPSIVERKKPSERIVKRQEIIGEIARLRDEQSKLEAALATADSGGRLDATPRIRDQLQQIQDQIVDRHSELNRISANAVDVFFSYAHEDEPLRDEMAKQLALMRNQGMITSWHDRKILPGEDWATVIDSNLETADVILLLVSPDFMASEYCYAVEMQRAMERHEAGEAVVIPVILRPVPWTGAPFGKLQALPKDGEPVTLWENADAAFFDIALGIQRAVEQLPKQSPS